MATRVPWVGSDRLQKEWGAEGDVGRVEVLEKTLPLGVDISAVAVFTVNGSHGPVLSHPSYDRGAEVDLIRFQRKWIEMPAAVLLMAVLFVAVAAASPLEDAWPRLNKKLDETLSLIRKQRKAPDSSWIPFKEDKEDLDEEMDELLAEAVEILNVSDLSELKREIKGIQRNIREYERRIARLQTERLMAPEEVESWKVWKKDMADYQEEIAEYREAIAENRRRAEELKAAFAARIREAGISVDGEQIDTLLYSITGDDDVAMISVFDNIKAITGKLKVLTRESGENLETARRYYGMHVVLLKILLHLQKTYIDRINTEYVPSLTAIVEENRELMERTESLLKECEPRHCPMYAANLEAQELTDRTAKLYLRYLEQNKERVSDSKAQLRREYEIAENTYHTVSTAYALVDLLRDSERFFSALSELQVPDLLTFDNREMKEEFRKLTDKMAGE